MADKKEKESKKVSKEEEIPQIVLDLFEPRGWSKEKMLNYVKKAREAGKKFRGE